MEGSALNEAITGQPVSDGQAGRGGDELARLPLGGAASWRPQEIDGPREAGFLPLLFWLIEVRRPRTVIRLGLEEAQGFLAMCAAVEAARPGARCEGFAQDGDGGYALASAERRSFAAVSEMSAEAALATFEDGGIDVLSIDPGLPGPSLRDIARNVWGKVAPDGVVVIAGVPSGPNGQAAHRFLEEASPRRGGFEVTDAEGRSAVVLFADPQRSPAARYGAAEAAALSAALARLGDGPAARWTALEAERALAGSSTGATRDRPRLEGSELQALREELRAAQRGNALRFHETAALTAQLMRRERARERAVTSALQERDAILRSSFWRATAPARRVVDALRSLRRSRTR